MLWKRFQVLHRGCMELDLYQLRAINAFVIIYLDEYEEYRVYVRFDK